VVTDAKILLRRHSKPDRCFFGSDPAERGLAPELLKKRNTLMNSYDKSRKKNRALLEVVEEWILKDV
jgi:hypothetical protein